eukprot:6691580-Prymnesium_polylepis.1
MPSDGEFCISHCPNAEIAVGLLITLRSEPSQSMLHSRRVNLAIEALYCLRCAASSTLVALSANCFGCAAASNFVGSTLRNMSSAAPSVALLFASERMPIE